MTSILFYHRGINPKVTFLMRVNSACPTGWKKRFETELRRGPYRFSTRFRFSYQFVNTSGLSKGVKIKYLICTELAKSIQSDINEFQGGEIKILFGSEWAAVESKIKCFYCNIYFLLNFWKYSFVIKEKYSVLDSFDDVSRDEDKILDHIYI